MPPALENSSRERQRADDYRTTAAAPTTPPHATTDSLHDDLAAEIADHLASAEADLVRKGHAPAEAAQLARAQFGDIARILRQCWWIQQGDQIMTRAITIALLTVLTLTVAVLTFAGFQAQRTFSTRMDRLSEQLAKLVETQNVVAAQQEQQLPVSISGLAYLGDRSRPAAGAKLTLYHASPAPGTAEGCEAMRVLEADTEGTFRSGPLPTGVYFVVARLLDAHATPVQSAYWLQSKPFYLYDAGRHDILELDLLAKSRLKLALAHPFPNRIEADGQTGGLSFDFFVGPLDSAPVLPLNPLAPTGQETLWPLFATSADYHRLGRAGVQVRAPSDWPRVFAVPPGRHAVSVFLQAESWPDAEQGAAAAGGGFGGFAGDPIIGFGTLEAALQLADGEAADITVTMPPNIESDLRTSLKARTPILRRRFKIQVARVAAAREPS